MELVSCKESDERNIVVFLHRVLARNIPVILDGFHTDGSRLFFSFRDIFSVYFSRLDCLKLPAAAANFSVAGTDRHIAADRAYIKFTLFHISSHKVIFSKASAKHFFHIDTEKLCEFSKEADVRTACAAFPLRHGLIAYIQLVRKLFLRKPALCAKLIYYLSDFFVIHRFLLFLRRVRFSHAASQVFCLISTGSVYLGRAVSTIDAA